ncbi:hypothetical protein GCM10027189_15850 [Rufibacter soli]
MKLSRNMRFKPVFLKTGLKRKVGCKKKNGAVEAFYWFRAKAWEVEGENRERPLRRCLEKEIWVFLL